MVEREGVVGTRPGPIEFRSYYYSHDCGPTAYGRSDQWLLLFSRLADRIVEELALTRVLDVGCALGLLVEALHDRGVDAWGIDISECAISQVPESVADRCFVAGVTDEISQTLGAGPDGPGFDLVTCIEVVEHGPAAIARLSELSDRVLFSSEPTDYAEPTHAVGRALRVPRWSSRRGAPALRPRGGSARRRGAAGADHGAPAPGVPRAPGTTPAKAVAGP